MREQSEKVENVLHHFADNDKSKKAKILARIVDREGADFASEVFLKSKELKQTKKFTAEQTASILSKAMLTGEEYFPASFFCLRASSSWNDDIFDTDSFLRHKMIHLLRSLSLLPHWNLLIFLTCKSKYKNQRT